MELLDGKTLTFLEWLGHCMDESPTLCMGVRGVRLVCSIIFPMQTAKETLKISNEAYNAIKEGMDKIRIRPTLADKILPFCDAFENACEQPE
jgi:hypothetical protein